MLEGAREQHGHTYPAQMGFSKQRIIEMFPVLVREKKRTRACLGHGMTVGWRCVPDGIFIRVVKEPPEAQLPVLSHMANRARRWTVFSSLLGFSYTKVRIMI